MRVAWLVLLVLPFCGPAAADAISLASARAVIDQCNASAKADSVGLSALYPACPRIDEAADALGLDALLPKGWRTRVDVRALADLAAIAERYAAPAPHAPPDAAQLRTLAQTLVPPSKPPSWWDRALAWLRQWFSSGDSNLPSWWLKFHWPWHWSPSPRLWTYVFYALVAVVVVAAIVVTVIEIRAFRNPEGRRRILGLRGVLDSGSPDEAGPPLDALASAAADQQPVLALRLLVGALTRSRRLTRDRNLTCRELITAARFDGPSQQAQFQTLALLAERALYGDHQRPASPPAAAEASGHLENPPAHLDLEGIRTLYADLLAPRHEARSAS